MANDENPEDLDRKVPTSDDEARGLGDDEFEEAEEGEEEDLEEEETEP